MRKLRKHLALGTLLLLLSLPQVVTAQALPTTLVVKTTESSELCYDLTKISKITFTSGAIKIERSDANQHFTPETVTMSSIDKLFFAKDRKENTTDIASPRLAPVSTLSYHRVGQELHIEGFTSTDETLYVSTTEIGRWRKSGNPSVDILDYPARKRKILRNFHFILPKFHFILPKFYFPSPWRIFVCSLEILDFLGRDWT